MTKQGSIFNLVDIAERKLSELREASLHPEVAKTKSHFEESAFVDKLHADVLFLEHIYDEFVGNEELKSKFDQVVTEAVVAAHELLKEADIAPRMISPAVEFSTEPLSESETIEHYKRAFNLILEDQFNKPNIKGELLNEAGFGPGPMGPGPMGPGKMGPMPAKIIVASLKNGSLDGSDPEAVVKYAIAEKTVIDAIKNLLMPRGILRSVQQYGEGLPPEYEEVFGGQFRNNMQLFNKRCGLIGRLIAPFLFRKALMNSGANVPFKPSNVVGLSAVADDDVNLPTDEPVTEACNKSKIK